MEEKDRMKKTHVVLLIFMIFCLPKVQAKSNKQPNVILIMVDDQGYGDIACLGNKHIKTPNIDAFYEKSTRFTQYHVSPTCAPTRAAIMTGHHNNRAGVWHTVNGRSLILERETSMAQIFKQNGYATGIFGKWHLGDNYPFRPQDKGFDEVLVHGGGGIEQTMDYFDNDYFDDTYHHNGTLEKFDGFCTDVWFENAMQYIELKKEKDTPFFCYLSTNAAHSPYNVADKYSDPYKNNPDIPNAAFYGLLANVDENIGKLMQFLKEKNMMENTIVIFTTDNGTAKGAKVEGHRLDGFVVQGNNDGMRGIKASMYEGGHRVPMFIQWEKGKIPTGKDVKELTAHYDILPTLVDLCQLKVPKNIDFDGQSLVPLIKGKTNDFKDRVIVVNSQRTEVPEPWRRTSVMQGNYRLINETELYDLTTDPEQRTNVADKYPKKVKELQSEYDEWWKEIAPSYVEQPYIYIGHPAEKFTMLHCHDWHTDKDSPWHQRHIRQGYKDNGYWQLKVAKSGSYRLRLRRWPIETKLALCAGAPIRKALPGTSVTESKAGKALPIKTARIKIQEFEGDKEIDPKAEYVEFTVDLKKGVTNLQTWFTLKDKTEIGAYYVSIEKL